jgi:hypothetical protein
MKETIERLLLRPSRVELSVLYVLLGAHLVIGTDAAIPHEWLSFVLGSLLLLGALILLRISLLVICRIWPFAPSARWRWAEVVCIALGFAIIHTTSLGLILRVYASEHWLIRQVEEARASAMTEQRVRMPYGLFFVHDVHKSSSGVVWLTTVSLGSPLFDSPSSIYAGLVYSQSDAPPPRGESHYQHLYGPWWRWLQDM